MDSPRTAALGTTATLRTKPSSWILSTEVALPRGEGERARRDPSRSSTAKFHMFCEICAEGKEMFKLLYIALSATSKLTLEIFAGIEDRMCSMRA